MAQPKHGPNEQGLLPEELVEVPTFKDTPNCDEELIRETRQILKQRFEKDPERFYERDLNLLFNDDWTVSRFLLRCRLNPERSIDLVEAAASFRKEFKMGETKLSDFPAEIHQVGGIFQYAPDRVGNITLWMRARYHRRSNEMVHIMKQFILCVMEQCDRACNGRGVAVIFDLSNCGLKNADPSFLFWLLNSFRNYCPKGLSYIIVYNLPWVLNATCTLALTWLSSTNKRRLRFIEGEQIHKFIAPENLPDFVPGGQCKLDYRKVPENCEPVKPRPDDKLVPISEELANTIRDIHRKLTAEN
uniref:Motile sperm domain-containing protein 2 n=1 Tax=Aceria tosichella TaxID=561515 RepID=A0A6G1S5G1_9ACAR